MQENEPQPLQPKLDALEEIDGHLHQMLFLAQLSASDADVDRDLLQAVLEHLKKKIDQAADQL